MRKIYKKKNLEINTQKLKINPKNNNQKLKRFKRKIYREKPKNNTKKKNPQDPED
jgi:hypothetical protein